MVQNKSSSGRPLEFNRSKALDEAMNLFWEKGYSAVGISELEQKTKLNRSSLYNSFGSKEDIFKNALNLYSKEIAPQMMSELISGVNGLADLKCFIDKLIAHLTTVSGRGCFMVNTMAATSKSQPDISKVVEFYIEGFLSAIKIVLQRAVIKKEISKKNINTDAELLLAAVLSANLLSRAKQSNSLIKNILYSSYNSIKNAK
ncbi:MAG TPA: TetR/AcrR family transcriptional regulator [Gammaproteobacteria bacterium]|nr:TetR/AcrR family transcriptional regulator [Gammaproteobacteria bacterium]